MCLEQKWKTKSNLNQVSPLTLELAVCLLGTGKCILWPLKIKLERWKVKSIAVSTQQLYTLTLKKTLKPLKFTGMFPGTYVSYGEIGQQKIFWTDNKEVLHVSASLSRRHKNLLVYSLVKALSAFGSSEGLFSEEQYLLAWPLLTSAVCSLPKFSSGQQNLIQ